MYCSRLPISRPTNRPDKNFVGRQIGQCEQCIMILVSYDYGQLRQTACSFCVPRSWLVGWCLSTNRLCRPGNQSYYVPTLGRRPYQDWNYRSSSVYIHHHTRRWTGDVEEPVGRAMQRLYRRTAAQDRHHQVHPTAGRHTALTPAGRPGRCRGQRTSRTYELT